MVFVGVTSFTAYHFFAVRKEDLPLAIADNTLHQTDAEN